MATERTGLPPPHPLNEPGDFYVGDGCCTQCGAPFAEAPGLFAWSNTGPDSTCFVKRQPSTPAEQEQMVSAIRVAETACIRYRGTDPVVQERLAAQGLGAQCDAVLSPELQRRSDAAREAAHRQWRHWQQRRREWRALPWWRRLWRTLRGQSVA